MDINLRSVNKLQYLSAFQHHIPAFQHKQQEAAILERQSAKPTTVIEPFNLRTEQLAQLRQQNPKTPPPRCESPTFRTKSHSPCLYTGNILWLN